MALHFSREEFADRQRRAGVKMAEQGLDGMLVFRQESMYWLTGYDTEGFVMFQGLYLGADGTLALCTRLPDLYQARNTSVVEDVRIWRDREGATPADELRDMLDDLGCHGKRLGMEYHGHGLSGYWTKRVEESMDGFCSLKDASDLIRELRLIKSPGELVYLRRAGELSDQARDLCIERCVPGASIGAIYGDMLALMMAGGGDPTSNRWVVGGGDAALLGRYSAGLGTVGDEDAVTWEYCASYRHYHAGLMHVNLMGEVDPWLRDMHAVCVEALESTEETLRPGNTVGDVYEAYARTFRDAGHGDQILNACGYTMGACFPPTWMDAPWIHTGNPQPLEPGMVFFPIMVVVDRDAGKVMALAEQVIVTDGPLRAPEPRPARSHREIADAPVRGRLQTRPRRPVQRPARGRKS